MNDIILIERDINCSNISKDDFVNAIKEDMINAKQALYNLLKSHYDELNEIYVQQQINKINNYANKKYKKDFYKQKYVNNEISKINKNYYHVPEFTYADFDVEPDKLGIPYNCIIVINDFDRINKCYDYVKNNEYFKKILGWQIIYVNSARPYFKFITDAETEKDMNRRILEHRTNVRNFLSETTYFGD